MLMLALSLMAAVALGQDYEFVSATEIVSTVKMESSEITEAPEGSIITWKPTARNLVLELENTSTTVMQVDWNSSAFVDIDGVASGIVPGSTIRGDYQAVVAPSTLPPGSKIVEVVVRESAIHLADGTEADEALVERWEEGKDVAVTLALVVNGETLYHTQRFSVGPDHEHLAILEEQRKAEHDLLQQAEARKRAELLYQKKWDKYTGYRKKAWIFGSTLVGGGALVALMSATDPEMKADGTATLTALGLGVLPMAVGVPLTIHFGKKAKHSKEKLPNRPVGYEPE
jgi:hypothetical protein